MVTWEDITFITILYLLNNFAKDTNARQFNNTHLFHFLDQSKKHNSTGNFEKAFKVIILQNVSRQEITAVQLHQNIFLEVHVKFHFTKTRAQVLSASFCVNCTDRKFWNVCRYRVLNINYISARLIGFS